MSDFIILNSKTDSVDTVGDKLELTRENKILIDGEYTDYTSENSRVLIIGDYIGNEAELLNVSDNEIPKLRGNFYAIVVRDEMIKIYTSFFSILPIYYNTQRSIISSSIELIKKNDKQNFSIDKKYILENILFNYGFFNRTLYREIKLLPCHSYLTISSKKVFISKHYETIDLFSSKVNKGKKVSRELSDMFIETTKNYFPEAPFDIAFTGGFDGRVLVSCATHHNKKHSTFSFGRPKDDDVSIPKRNAEALNIPYQYFDLGSPNYYEESYYENAIEFASKGYKGNGFLYSHFLYSTKKISQQSQYLLSGVVGSELFRALHTTGAVTSEALVDIFKTTDDLELIKKIRNNKALKVLKKEEFAYELDELISELIIYKRALPMNLPLNQRFYLFVFEETFRKFFGQWIVTQQKHIKVRTPFLDFKFIQALLKTKYAGANNDFFTNNPIKRIKGQYIYADIIKKTNTLIYRQTTGKGYRPKDVRNFLYNYKILLPFLTKRLKRNVKKTNLDNLGIISGVKANQEKIRSIISKALFFDEVRLNNMLRELTPHTQEKVRDAFLMSLSILSNINKPKKVEKAKPMNSIIALMDYKAKFGSKHFDTPYRSGMDKDRLTKYFKERGFQIEYKYLNEVDIKDKELSKKNIIYTSSEDIGYKYKSYIEDIVFALELSGAKVIPAYKHLRANNNKVFMELLGDQVGLVKNIDSFVFGSMKDLLMHLDNITYPMVLKTSAGASGTGVYLVNTEKELITKVKDISQRDFIKDLKDYGRALKHSGYIKESIFRQKFILQEFIPNLKNDWKIYVFGDRLYVFKRPILKNRGIKASGGGYDNYFYGLQANAPDGLFDYAIKIFNAMNVPNISIDIAYDGEQFYLIEFQSVYFGTAGIPYSEGYFCKMKEGWRFVNNKFEIEKVYADSIARFIDKNAVDSNEEVQHNES